MRHRTLCRYKSNCYHYISGNCEYIHLTPDLLDVPMAKNDNERMEAHKGILTAPSPQYKERYDKEKEKVMKLEKLNDEHKK